jgi:hypothetical protein
MASSGEAGGGHESPKTVRSAAGAADAARAAASSRAHAATPATERRLVRRMNIHGAGGRAAGNGAGGVVGEKVRTKKV